MKGVYIHPTAIVEEGAEIGEGSYIWHFAHVRSNAKIGENFILGKGSYIDGNVTIGDNVKVQNFVSVYNGVTIGSNVFVGPHVAFTNDMYPRIGFDWEISKTVIGDNVSIGANSTIVCGSILEQFSFVAAGTLVPAKRRVWPHALIMGNPGRIRGWVCKCGRKLDTQGVSENVEIEIDCTHCREKNRFAINGIGRL